MKNNGFTLIEVIISILLIGVISVAVAPMFYQGLRTVLSFTSKTDAVNEARSDLIDDLRGTGTTTPTTVTINFTNNGGLNKSITASAYSIKSNYSLPGVGQETVELNYYTYPISP